MKNFFLRVKWLIWKEFLSTVKDPRTRAILIAPVIVQSILFGHAATFNLDNVPYALLDLSRSKISTEFVSKLEGGGIFQRVLTLSSTNEIAQVIDSGVVVMVVTIAPDFEREIIAGRAGKLQIITDGRNTMTASVASGYLGRIVDEFNGSRKIQLETVAWFNPNLITRWNFLPGLMGLLSLIQVMLLAGLSVAREREQGTFDQLLVTPLSPAEILIGKAVVPVVISIFNLPIRVWNTICRKFTVIVRGFIRIYAELHGIRAVNLCDFKFNATSHGLLLCFDIADGFTERIRHSCRQYARSFTNFDLRRPVALCIGLVTANLS